VELLTRSWDRSQGRGKVTFVGSVQRQPNDDDVTVEVEVVEFAVHVRKCNRVDVGRTSDFVALVFESLGYRNPQYRADPVLRSPRILEEARLRRRDQRWYSGRTLRLDLREFSGIVFPMKRRIFPRQPDGHSVPEPLVVSIDLDQFVLS